MEIFWVWFGIAVLTGVAASSKGKTGFGWFVLGAMFSILALLIIVVLPSFRWVLRSIVPTDSGLSCPAIPVHRARPFRFIAPSLRD
jgi:hypothetical protein